MGDNLRQRADVSIQRIDSYAVPLKSIENESRGTSENGEPYTVIDQCRHHLYAYCAPFKFFGRSFIHTYLNKTKLKY